MQRRQSLIGCLLLLFLVIMSGCKKKRDVWAQPYTQSLKSLTDDAFALVITSNSEGYVQPCGCTSSPLGGISRFATVFNDVKAALKERLAFIDAGNLLFEFDTRNVADKCQDDRRIDLLVGTISKLGVLFTSPDTLDDALGPEYRVNVYKRHGINTLMPMNMRLINAPNFAIGVIAVTKDTKKQSLETVLKHARENKALKLVIALSHLSIDQTKLFFADLQSVDVVIQAGKISSTEPKAPTALNASTFYLETGRQGQHFSMLLLQNLSKRQSEKIELDTRLFENNARLELLTTRINALNKQLKEAVKDRRAFLKQRLATAQNELAKLKTDSLPPMSTPNLTFFTVALTRKIDPDDTVDKALLAYEASIPELVKKCEENIQCPKPKAGSATFVGATTCKSCHEAAFNVWQNGVFPAVGLDENGKEITRMVGHSKAWKTLIDDKKDADRSCIGCHSIGFMKEGGYCKAFDVDFRKNVQCESCHGAGSLHAESGDKKFIRRQVPEETCRGCHHVPHIQTHDSFNYHEKLVKILGPGHGEKLLHQLTHTPKN